MRDMDDAALADYQKQYLEKIRAIFLQAKNRNVPEYVEAYHKWFLLRTEGEKRGLWNFIPSRNE